MHPIPVFSYNWAGLNLCIKLCGWTRHSVLHYIEFLSLLLFSMIQIRQWNQYISSIKQCTVCIVLYITILYYRIKTNNNVDSSHKKITMKHYPYFAHFRDNFPCYWNRVARLFKYIFSYHSALKNILFVISTVQHGTIYYYKVNYQIVQYNNIQ